MKPKDANEQLVSDFAASVDEELGLSERDAEWLPWADEVAIGGDAHSAGRDQGWPVLHFDDVSAIPFLQEISGVEFYQLRARLRACTGDLFAATCPAVPGYAEYNEEHLGLGAPRFVFAEPVESASQIALACEHGEAFQSLEQAARVAGGMTLHPYMGAEPSWRLARKVSEKAQVQVRCIGPRPAICAYTNQKAHVTRAALALLDDGVLGGAPVAETRFARDAEGLADALLELAKNHKRVALKMTKCASAMGNGLFESETLLREGRAKAVGHARAFLAAKEWSEGDEVLVSAWEDAWSSPSTQLWIPSPDVGPPVVEGVYEQLLVGPEQVFLGALPSRLGSVWDERLSEASRRMAHLYQLLGYRGRCSFDFIIAGDAAHLVECNGRWGGTSTPMHLVERVWPGPRPVYRARDVVSEALVGVSFEEVQKRLEGQLYDVRTGQGTFMLYNVGCLAEHGKVDVVALGTNHEDVEEALEERLPRLLGL